MTLEERLADSMSLSRGPGPPGHSQPCKRTSALSIIVSDITNLLQYGRNQEACALAASSRAVLPYALVSMVSRLKQGDPIKPPMVIFFADMAHLFPSVRPILKNALPQASLIGLIDSADVSTQDHLALSMLMLHMAGSLSSIAISINALGHDQPAVRWVAAVAISQNLCLSASESNQLLLQTLSDEELRHSEALWERRQIDVQVLIFTVSRGIANTGLDGRLVLYRLYFVGGGLVWIWESALFRMEPLRMIPSCAFAGPPHM